KSLDAKTEAQRFNAVQRLVRERKIPRVFGVADGDNILLVDCHNPLSIESFVQLVHRRTQAIIQEVFPPPQRLVARGEEGRFTHKLVVPFCRKSRNEAADRTAPPLAKVSVSEVQRSFHPGSDCLYLKIYTGTTTGDQLLHEVVGPLVARAREIR